MGDYTLIIELDQDVIRNQSTDNLCIAKKVNDAYTVIFAAGSVVPTNPDTIQQMTNSTTFSWRDKYRVYYAAQYSAGMMVSSSTNHQEIKFGQTVTYTPQTGMEPATGEANDSGQFVVTGSPGGQYRVAVEVESGSSWVPIFVDPESHGGDPTTTLTPKEDYALYWSNTTETNSMIATTLTPSYSFSYAPGQDSTTLRYGYKIPDHPGPGEQFGWYQPTP
ncbi:hypothetical protein TWF506_003256 [Arthrobotrys conoides]|uniref:Uncharacterized protein n=1 Tax=Arthrobotrys conoides TaxID=74498 RepID=A0AAN8RL16_9PEZI